MRWCTGRGVVPFPAEAAAVCTYLVDMADQGLSVASLDSACSAVGHQHRSRGVPDPVDHDAVRQVRRGLRRIIGRGPRRPARPLSVDDLRQILAVIDRTTVHGARDTAILLMGFAGALRRCELAALTLADLESKPTGLLLHLRRSKTDQEGCGQVVGIVHGRRPSLVPISGNVISNVVKDRATAAGFAGDRISGHSLRAGHATSAALAGISIDRIAAQTRHRRIDILIDRYIRPVQALQTTSSRDLGL